MKSISFAAIKQKINFHPHAVQKYILQNMGRFTVVASAKRLGKTFLAAYLGLREMWMPRHTVWIIGPNYELASRVWDYIEEWIDRYFAGEQGPFRVNKHDRIIENNVTGAKLWMKTSETTESLLGKGLDLAIMDEAARIDDGIWDGYIRPNLIDKNGRAFLISNPFGYNWFYEKYLWGTPEGRVEHPEYISFSFPTAIEDENGEVIGTNNPYAVSVEELRNIKAATPRDIWVSEYLGEFKEGAGQRFKKFDQCIDDSIIVDDPNEWFETPIPGHLYFLGCDIAKIEDFTVATVVDRMTHRVVGFYRANNLSWQFMRAKIKDISQKYNNAEIILDATGNGGDIFSEDLKNMGANVDVDFVYTNKSKRLLIDKLAILMDRNKISFPRIPQLIQEIRSFSYRFSPSGNIIYGSSRKDDCLNSLALACWKLNEEPLGIGLDSSNFVIRPNKRTYY